VVKLGVVPHVVNLMLHQKKALRKEACFFLSNIAAGTNEQAAIMMNCPGLIANAKKVLDMDEVPIRLEAGYMVANLATKKNDYFNDLLLTNRVFESMCDSIMKSLTIGKIIFYNYFIFFKP
jgi:hypothetical protein